MNSDVFLSLLALESNNRGYGQNVGSRSSAGSLGSATIIGTSLPTGPRHQLDGVIAFERGVGLHLDEVVVEHAV